MRGGAATPPRPVNVSREGSSSPGNARPHLGIEHPDAALIGEYLTRTFGEGERLTPALDDVSLSVARGEVALLIGPSGSGKSTLLAVLSGLLRPNAGRVVALGEDIWAMSDVERER